MLLRLLRLTDVGKVAFVAGLFFERGCRQGPCDAICAYEVTNG